MSQFFWSKGKENMLEVKYAKQEENVNEREELDREPEKLKKIPELDLNICGFGDEYFFFEGECGNPRYENIEQQWEEFIKWIEKIAESKKNEEGEDAEYAYGLGQEVLKWARDWDTYGLYMLTRVHWAGFRDNYLTKDAPKIVREFIDEIMYNKMTEKEKWGTAEDRRASGKLMIFADMEMTPEESYRLTMKEKRQKYDPKKHEERVKRDFYEMQEMMKNF